MCAREGVRVSVPDGGLSSRHTPIKLEAGVLPGERERAREGEREREREEGGLGLREVSQKRE